MLPADATAYRTSAAAWQTAPYEYRTVVAQADAVDWIETVTNKEEPS
ncbi:MULTISPECIES: hypothetical protein [Cryobacterium]|nr:MULTISPECIES: hypothetical protein [Cryobacterium]